MVVCTGARLRVIVFTKMCCWCQIDQKGDDFTLRFGAPTKFAEQVVRRVLLASDDSTKHLRTSSILGKHGI